MAVNKKTGLGKGLGALIETVETSDSNGTLELDINQIEPTLGQPRKYFDTDKIEELAESIQKHGLIQPLIVSKDGEIYRIIAGERRWRASKKAGLKKIPVVIKEVTPKESMELAIIENIQREDLNPIEEAEAYERLSKEYQMTQDEIAESVGKSRPAVTNTLRLLTLSEGVRKMIIEGSLSAGHARCIASIKDQDMQNRVAAVVVSTALNVRQTEEYVKKLSNQKEKRKKAEKPKNDNKVEIQYIENELRDIFNTKVTIREDQNKGKIEIEYYSPDERERLLELLKKK